MYKAVHKESGQSLAIKQVPVDADLQDIIKEISIMQQCDRYIIIYYVLMNMYNVYTNVNISRCCLYLASFFKKTKQASYDVHTDK